MEKRILVAYATKYGSTAEIAERISEVIRRSNPDVDVVNVKQGKDLAPYPVVVLGSALYMGQWRKEAVKFLQDNEAALAQKKIWLFASGPSGKGDPKKLAEGMYMPKSLQPVVDRIQPKDFAVFHGNVDPSRINFLEKWILRQVKAETGDFRDWKAIEKWAAVVAKSMK
jgi:menaquinone-dependent protoporphyrinogen oxidase